MTDLAVETTPVPGLLVLRLRVHADARGWFKENWQREKMTALGLPDFGPVQNNMSFNAHRGATRGIHAEPWDKLVSVATGRVFGAWVDLREGPSFGRTFHLGLDPATSVYVPRGVGNSYQALEDATVYSYLVNDHWRPGATYPALHVGDPTVGVPWPIPLDQAEISEKDRRNPTLDAVQPMKPRKTLIVGAAGQLGRALRQVYLDADLADVATLDLTDADQVGSWPWREYGLVLNAAGYTAVDTAETPEGRSTAWAVNAHAPATLARLAAEHRFVLVHYSTDYVFDGTRSRYDEEEPMAPLGVYAQTKAAGDLAVCTSPRHYVLRTSWVVGEGHNFVRTMASLAVRGVAPSVVDDQVGRLTFASELARATRHLCDTGAPFGTYNCTNAGPPTSWAQVARQVFELCGRRADEVTPVSTEKYARGRQVAPRPRHSTLDLAKLEATGFRPEEALPALRAYVAGLRAETHSGG